VGATGLICAVWRVFRSTSNEGGTAQEFQTDDGGEDRAYGKPAGPYVSSRRTVIPPAHLLLRPGSVPSAA
jgi:hypothetical protein